MLLKCLARPTLTQEDVYAKLVEEEGQPEDSQEEAELEDDAFCSWLNGVWDKAPAECLKWESILVSFLLWY